MKPLLSTVDAVLFDLDGTLVETNIDFPLMKREMIALAIEQGIDSSDVSGLDILAIVDVTVKSLVSQDKTIEAEALRKRAMQILEEIELVHANSTHEIECAREIINMLKTRGIKIGIVTRNCRKASEISLKITCIEPDIMICREDAVNHKPHPDPIHMALSALEARIEASIMVGDHIMDIASGKAAGVKTIAVLRDERPCDFFAEIGPDIVVTNLKEVADAIIGSDC